jgi:hypothetical protein
MSTLQPTPIYRPNPTFAQMSAIDSSPIADRLDHTWASDCVQNGPRIGSECAGIRDASRVFCDGVVSEPSVMDRDIGSIQHEVRDVPRFSRQFTVNRHNTRFATVEGSEVAIRISKKEKEQNIDPDASVKSHNFIYDQVLCKINPSHSVGATVTLPVMIGYNDKDADNVLHSKEVCPSPNSLDPTFHMHFTLLPCFLTTGYRDRIRLWKIQASVLLH